MIYLDNAATSFPKPPAVHQAIALAMKKYAANPGRSGHKMSLASAQEVYSCRQTLAKFFGAPGPECVAFTLNCTHAINMALKGLLRPGDHVVCSCLEHNAVMRPLEALKKVGVTVTQAEVFPGDNDATVNSFREALNEKTCLVVCMHASNVWGIRLPISRISALAHQYNIPILVDAAQSAGHLPIDIKAMGIDFLCIAGHKGLLGPMGTGALITEQGAALKTIVEGGTGTDSVSYEQPAFMPERLESGTVNVPGIAGLRAGVEFLQKVGTDKIAKHEHRMISKLYEALHDMKNIELYMPKPDPAYFVPLLSFNVKDRDSEEIAATLSEQEIYVRAGLHCSPAAHSFGGTLERGTVRACPSYFTTPQEITKFSAALKKI